MINIDWLGHDWKEAEKSGQDGLVIKCKTCHITFWVSSIEYSTRIIKKDFVQEMMKTCAEIMLENII